MRRADFNPSPSRSALSGTQGRGVPSRAIGQCPNQRQAHRTARTALGEAVRRGYTAKNAAALDKPPRMEEGESEVEPYSVEEVQCLLLEANKRRNSARWMLALALGLRQGETLGLRWSDVDLDNEYLKLRRNRLRPRYKHGCPETSPCGRAKAGYCPDKVQVRRKTKNTKSRAGRRAVPLPGPLLRAHAETQERERKAAGDLWVESDYVFTKLLGGPLSPNTGYHHWKRLLEDARSGTRGCMTPDTRPPPCSCCSVSRTASLIRSWGGSRAPPRACARGTCMCRTPCSRTWPGRSPMPSGDPRKRPLWTKTRTTRAEDNDDGAR